MKAGSISVIARCRLHNGGYHSATFASVPRKAEAPKMIRIKPASEISEETPLRGFSPSFRTRSA